MIADLLDRSIARIRREVIRLSLVSKGEVEELLRGNYAALMDFEIQEQVWQRDFLNLEATETFRNESHVWQPRYSILLKDVVVDTRTGLLFSNEGKIIVESSAWPIQSLLLNSLPVPFFSKIKKVASDNFTNIVLPGNSFYHWLIEDLPVVLQLVKRRKNPRLIVSKNRPRYVSNFLDATAIPFLEVSRFAKLEDVSIINRNADVGWAHPKDLLTLREHFQTLYSDNKDLKIYVTRKGSSRFEEYENYLMDFLKLDGWIIFSSESYSLLEQVTLFSRASVVVGAHGAGMCGMVWMGPQARVIEIFPLRRVQVFYRMAAELNLNYSQIYINQLNSSSAASPQELAILIKTKLNSLL